MLYIGQPLQWNCHPALCTVQAVSDRQRKVSKEDGEVTHDKDAADAWARDAFGLAQDLRGKQVTGLGRWALYRRVRNAATRLRTPKLQQSSGLWLCCGP